MTNQFRILLLKLTATLAALLAGGCNMPPLAEHSHSEHDHEFGAARSSCWPAARAEYIAAHPKCEACGGTHNLQVHHARPFNLDTLRDGSHPHECDQANLITLCTGDTINCHLWIGHAGNFKKYNERVREDAKRIAEMIANRKDNQP